MRVRRASGHNVRHTPSSYLPISFLTCWTHIHIQGYGFASGISCLSLLFTKYFWHMSKIWKQCMMCVHLVSFMRRTNLLSNWVEYWMWQGSTWIECVVSYVWHCAKTICSVSAKIFYMTFLLTFLFGHLFYICTHVCMWGTCMIFCNTRMRIFCRYKAVHV